MPQHRKGGSTPVCRIPTDTRLRTTENDNGPDSASGNHISSDLTKLFSRNDSDTDDFPNSQGSASSVDLFHGSSQGSNDECAVYPDLSDLVNRVSKHTAEYARISRLMRSHTPTEDIVDPETNRTQLEVTPVKGSVAPELDPLTPTANLKMLINAASPEIRHRERQRELERTEVEQAIVQTELPESATSSKESAEVASAVSRKEKSLGLLCQRFLARYPGHPGPQDREEICLDEVAKELMVERRRIYDIVNVLESVEMVSRVAKNRYTWHGKSTLQATLLNLKMLAEGEGFAEKIERIRLYEEFRDAGEMTFLTSRCKNESLMLNDVSNVQRSTLLEDNYGLRKDKSLGIMSQKFLMLFLISQSKPINLDQAAKIIIGDPSIDLTENAKFKTKIRRLYDIANILTSLDLIRKVHLTESKGRKPAFKYIGPEVGIAKTVTDDGHQRPTSRHSLLDCIKKPQVCLTPTSKDSVSTANQAVADSMQGSLSSQRLPIRKPFSRHMSLDQICEVAEQERNRLYFESKSQPSSPVKQRPTSKRALLPKTKSMPPVLLRNGAKAIADQTPASPDPESIQASLKHFVMIRSQHGSRNKEEISDKKNSTVTIQKLPIKMSAEHGLGTGETHEKVVLKTCRLLQQTKGNGERQPRLVKVSRDQLDSVLKSLQQGKLPVSTGSPVNSVVATQPRAGGVTQNVPKIHVLRMQHMPQLGLSTPVDSQVIVEVQPGSSRKRPNKDLPEVGSDCYFDSKRPRFGEAATEQSGLQDHCVMSKLINEKCRPSPQALYLNPEFQPSLEQGEKTPSPEPTAPRATAVPVVGNRIASPHLNERGQTPALLTPRQQTPEVIEGAFTEVITSMAQPVLQFAKSSCSPVLVPSTPTTYSPVPTQLVALHAASEKQVTPVQEQRMAISLSAIDTGKYIRPIRSSSPMIGKQFQAEVATSHHTCPQLANPALRATSSRMVSPVPIHVPPMTVVPQPGFTVKQFRGIRPSSNAIINLIPHLAGDATVTTVDLSSGLMQQVPLMTSPGTTPTPAPLLLCQNQPSMVTPTQNLLSQWDQHHMPSMTHANILLTPQNQEVLSPAELLTPTCANISPSEVSCHMPVTPSTYFRSTPGGMYQLTTVPHIVLGQPLSAFQPLNSFAAHTATASSTARRLTLVEGDNIV